MAFPDTGAIVYGALASNGSPAEIGCSAPTQASGTLTLAANAAAGETVTIGQVTYTWVSALTTTGNQVLVAGSASDSIDNLIAAVNGAAGQGTLYSVNTAVNKAGTASAGAGDTMVFTASAITQPGAAGNQVVTTETMSNASWGAATLTGGIGAALNVAASFATGSTVAISQATPGTTNAVQIVGGVVRTFALTAATGNGSVATGKKAVAFSSSSDFAGTITAAAFGASQTVGVSADGPDTIGSIAYTVSAGTLYIATLT